MGRPEIEMVVLHATLAASTGASSHGYTRFASPLLGASLGLT